jgi:hypothetical protein
MFLSISVPAVGVSFNFQDKRSAMQLVNNVKRWHVDFCLRRSCSEFMPFCDGRILFRGGPPAGRLAKHGKMTPASLQRIGFASFSGWLSRVSVSQSVSQSVGSVTIIVPILRLCVPPTVI